MKRSLGFILILSAAAGGVLADPVVLSPAEPVAGQNLTITYDPTCTPLDGDDTIYLRYGFNDFSVVVSPDPLVSSNGAPFQVTVPVPAQATDISLAFRNDADPQVFDNNDGQNYTFAVTNGLPNAPRASISPDPAQAGQNVTVSYDPSGTELDGESAIYLHYGFNNWGWVTPTDVLMTDNGMGIFQVTVPVKSYAAQMDFVFANVTATIYDDNDDFNWHFDVTGTVPAVSISPNPPVAGQPVTITYNPEDRPLDVSTTGAVYIHWGINAFAATAGPDIPMTQMGDVWVGTIPSVPTRAEVLAFVFNNTGDDNAPGLIYDNNGGNDWRYDVVGAEPLTNELDKLFVAKQTDYFGPGLHALTLGIGGNLKDNGSAFVIFINTPGMAGQTQLRTVGSGGPGSMDYASQQIDTLACDTVGEGTILPGEADYALYVNRSGNTVYFNQYYLSGTPVPGQEFVCCDGSTLPGYATQIYAGSTQVNDGDIAFEDDQGLFYEGGFSDADTNAAPGQSASGLEITIPYFDIGDGNLVNGQAISVFVALMPNDAGLFGQFSNQMLPVNTGELCNPPQILPLRPDLTEFTAVWSGNTGTLPNFTGVADGTIVPANYGGSAVATQTCPAADMVPDPAVTIETPLVQGEDVTVTYRPQGGPLDGSTTINMEYSIDEFATSDVVAMTEDACEPGAYSATVYIDSNGSPRQLSLKFNDGVNEDDNSGQLWEYEIARKTAGAAVTINPNPAQSGAQVTVTYDPTGRVLEGAASVTMHYGFNTWSLGVTDVVMTPTVDCKFQATITVSSLANGAQGLNLAFNNGSGTWDNNGGADWHFPVQFVGQAPPWVMDGALDCCATLIGTSANGARHLYAGLKDGWVYVATESTRFDTQNDHFIMIADEMPASLVNIWAKGGSVGAHDGRLNQESTNGWTGWQDGIEGLTSPQSTSTNYVEGAFQLSVEFPSVPTTLWISHAAFGTNNGGVLQPATQIPSGNGNGNVEGEEFMALDLSTVERNTFAAADFDHNCSVDAGDNEVFVLCLGGPASGSAGSCPGGVDADLNNDGHVDLKDFAEYTRQLGGCAALDGE